MIIKDLKKIETIKQDNLHFILANAKAWNEKSKMKQFK